MVSAVLWLAAALTLGSGGDTCSSNSSSHNSQSSFSSAAPISSTPLSFSNNNNNNRISPVRLSLLKRTKQGIPKFVSNQSFKLFSLGRDTDTDSDIDSNNDTPSQKRTRRIRRKRSKTNDSKKQHNTDEYDTAIAHDERVIFFPTAAKRICLDLTKEEEEEEENENVNKTKKRKGKEKEENGWEIPIHGWIFEPEEGSFRRRAFLALLRSALDIDHNDDEDKYNKKKKSTTLTKSENHETNTTITGDTNDEMLEEVVAEEQEEISGGDRSTKEILARRLRPFIVDNERGRTISIRIGNAIHRVPDMVSSKNGHFHGILRLSDQEVEEAMAMANKNKSSAGGDKDNKRSSSTILRFEAVTGHDERTFHGVTHLIPPKGGISVISDIDDTVKISHVTDKKKLVRSTFLQEFKAVPGMANTYQQWSNSPKHNAQFHFVSSSPYQLYEELSSFFTDAGFPHATFHLKTIRLKDRTLLSLFGDPEKTKIDTITSILQRYPNRKFVLVGDTGERDPEVYGHMLRQYPHQILRVFLRDVPPKPIKVSPQKKKKKTNPSRLSSKFKRNNNTTNKKKKNEINNNNHNDDGNNHDEEETGTDNNTEDDDNNSSDIISPESRLLYAFRGTPHEKWSLFTEGSTLHLPDKLDR